MNPKDHPMSRRYEASEAYLERALKVIPLGTQTFSKSFTQYPRGVSPYFIQKGRGAHVWDVDGNEYVDFVNGLASITLGYNDPDVNAAVLEQLQEGTIFSLAHPIEVKVAEKLAELVPCAEMVRFGKNGSDATSGAIRLARAFTQRDRVAVCGYHGWQDWYIGSTARHRGVPKATRELTHAFSYNDLESLRRLFKEWPGQFAAVILEPQNVVDPQPGFLEGVRELAHHHGALLVFDETITGFRYAKGGAQELYGVEPDLATFGKGLANGYPISAVAGKAKYMRLMEEIFFSFTFGGETLSLAASLATMTKVQREPVVERMREQGTKIRDGVSALIAKHRIGHFLKVSGHPSWTFLVFADAPRQGQWALKTLFLQEIYARGVLFIGSHNMSYAHSDADIAHLLKTYDQAFGVLAEAATAASLEGLLRCKPLEPLFKVR
jgi:glutamate-1-semialdehyde 2,1-aminomutase